MERPSSSARKRSLSPSFQGYVQPQLQPSLLPPFEPVSSSPTGLPKPRSRKRDLSPSSRAAESRPYPTPVPTSSTALQTSSPPLSKATRPNLARTVSSLSERAPLGELPTAQLARDGTPILFGRSSNSSHFQLSSNRLISRIHVEASYESPSEQYEHGRVLVKCLGWNGARVMCKNISHFLEKGHTSAFSNPSYELKLDVQDARVIIKWPPARVLRNESEFSDSTVQPSPVRNIAADFPSSPPVGPLHSPISPSPRRMPAAVAPIPMPSLNAGGSSVQIYEDAGSDEEQIAEGIEEDRNALDTFRDLDGEEDMRNPSQSAASFAHEQASHASSVLSSPEDLSDHDEENDPFITSFCGPSGANLLPRMASMHATSPQRSRLPLKSTNSTPTKSSNFSNEASPTKPTFDLSPIRNHVVNQLAFSRVHALPLGTIYTNLPASFREPKSAEDGQEKRTFTKEDLKGLLDSTAAVGEIAREGKDAAGKPLEDEFYYVPELDTDAMRKSAVQTSLGKTSMRAVRKQHKQYYWKRPRY